MCVNTRLTIMLRFRGGSPDIQQHNAYDRLSSFQSPSIITTRNNSPFQSPSITIDQDRAIHEIVDAIARRSVKSVVMGNWDESTTTTTIITTPSSCCKNLFQSQQQQEQQQREDLITMMVDTVDNDDHNADTDFTLNDEADAAAGLLLIANHNRTQKEFATTDGSSLSLCPTTTTTAGTGTTTMIVSQGRFVSDSVLDDHSIQVRDETSTQNCDCTGGGGLQQHRWIPSSPASVSFAVIPSSTMTSPSRHHIGGGVPIADSNNDLSPMSALASFLSIPIEDRDGSDDGTATDPENLTGSLDSTYVRKATSSSSVVIDTAQLSLMASAALMNAAPCKVGNKTRFQAWTNASSSSAGPYPTSPHVMGLSSPDSKGRTVQKPSSTIKPDSPYDSFFDDVRGHDVTTTTPIRSVSSPCSYGSQSPWSPVPASMPPPERKSFNTPSRHLASLDRSYWNLQHQLHNIPSWHPAVGEEPTVSVSYRRPRHHHHQHDLSTGIPPSPNTKKSMSPAHGSPWTSLSSSSRTTADPMTTTTTTDFYTTNSKRTPVWWKRQSPPRSTVGYRPHGDGSVPASVVASAFYSSNQGPVWFAPGKNVLPGIQYQSSGSYRHQHKNAHPTDGTIRLDVYFGRKIVNGDDDIGHTHHRHHSETDLDQLSNTYGCVVVETSGTIPPHTNPQGFTLFELRTEDGSRSHHYCRIVSVLSMATLVRLGQSVNIVIPWQLNSDGWVPSPLKEVIINEYWTMQDMDRRHRGRQVNQQPHLSF